MTTKNTYKGRVIAYQHGKQIVVDRVSKLGYVVYVNNMCTTVYAPGVDDAVAIACRKRGVA